MAKPRVSVCILTHNHDKYIRDCIMSAVSQASDVELEILVGDDQSTDGTEAIVRGLEFKFAGTIRYFRHERRLGPGGNYTFLLDEVRGEYVAHLDGDDYWLPGKLARQVSMLDRFPEVSASYTNAIVVNDNGLPLGVFNNNQPEIFGFEYLLESGNFLNNSSLLYRSIFKESIRSWAGNALDYRVHLYLASQGRLNYVNTFGVVYRLASATSVIVNHGERVRELYWQAITSVPPDDVRQKCKLYASADFLRRIFFRSVRVRSAQLFWKWWNVVSPLHKNRRAILGLHVLQNIVLTCYRELLSRIAAGLGGTRLRVIYWR